MARGEPQRTFGLEIQLDLATLCEAREAGTAKSGTVRSFECHQTAPIQSLEASRQSLIVPEAGGIGDESVLPWAKLGSQIIVVEGSNNRTAKHKTKRGIDAFELEFFGTI